MIKIGVRKFLNIFFGTLFFIFFSIALILIEESTLGILSSTWFCDSKIDQGRFRICAKNVQEDSIGYWYADISLGEQFILGTYRHRGGGAGAGNKFSFGSHENASVQIRMESPSRVQLLIDGNEVGKFQTPEDFINLSNLDRQ